ncbi:MAG: hypothetical protein ACPGOY_09045 [Rhodospirillaceae bacterium]
MSRRFLRVISLILLGLVPAACQTTGTPSPGTPEWNAMTPQERRLQRDNQIFNETIAGGAVEGAVIGAVLGLALGVATGDMDNALIGAGIGAGAGALVGGFDGWRTATKQEANRRKIREIKAATDKIAGENRKLRSSIANIDTVIQQTQAKLETARANYNQNKGSLAEVQAAEARTRRNLDMMDDLIDSIEDRQDELQEISNTYRQEGENTAEIDREIAATRTQLAQRKKERDLLEQELEQGVVG